MSDAGDRQDVAEALDVDKINDDRGAEDELADYPADAPVGVDEYGVTDAEDAIEEPLAERVLREEPDPLLAELEERAGALDREDTRDELGDPDDRDDLDELDHDLVLVDDEGDALTAGTAHGEQTAEEAAMHVIEDV